MTILSTHECMTNKHALWCIYGDTDLRELSFNFQHVLTTSIGTRHAHAPKRCGHIGTSGSTAIWPIGILWGYYRFFGGDVNLKWQPTFSIKIQNHNLLSLSVRALKKQVFPGKDWTKFIFNGEDELRGNKHQHHSSSHLHAPIIGKGIDPNWMQLDCLAPGWYPVASKNSWHPFH